MENVDIELLLALVKGSPCLYSKGDKGFKDKVRRENCWKEIAEALSITPSSCEDVFKKMKDKFLRERKNRKRSCSGDAAPEVGSQWTWYKDMEFLDGHIQERRRTLSNLSKNSSSTCDDTFLEEDQVERTTREVVCQLDEIEQQVNEDEGNAPALPSSSCASGSASLPLPSTSKQDRHFKAVANKKRKWIPQKWI